MRAAAERRFTQVRVEVDGCPVQVRRLDIRHDFLQVGGRNLVNLLLERDGRNRRGLILRDHPVTGGEVVQLLLTFQLLTLGGQLALGLLQLGALFVQLLLTLCQFLLLGGDLCTARIDLLLTLGEGVALLVEGVLLRGQLRLLGVELIHHLGG